MSTVNRNEAFRPEIEGLRATAAVLVVIYHIWLGRVSGGVDVFFVVSGFLITTALIKQVELTGRIKPLEFWGGLIRRLFPAAFLVLGCVAVASWLWLPKSLWLDTSKQIFASAIYLENWKLALNAVDYLAREEPPSPVQHYWALSVQVQFYALWPFLVAVAALMASRFCVSFRRALLHILVAAFAVSLIYSIYLTNINQPFAYFSTFTRIWEFSLGAILATVGRQAAGESGPIRHFLGWIGLLAILSCGLLLQVSTLFPGYAALWPTIGAILVLISSGSSTGPTAVWLLSRPLLVKLGGISYALYLWHWPILIFFRHQTGVFVPSLAEGAAILGISLLLAWVTTGLVEDPLRRRISVSRGLWASYAFGLAWAAPVALSALLWNMHVKTQYDEKVTISVSDPNYPGARAFEPGFEYAGAASVPIAPDFFQVKNDLPRNSLDGCHLKIEDTVPRVCSYGDPAGDKTLLLIGGSHAAHWLTPFDEAGKVAGWQVLSLTKSGCLFSNATQYLQSGKEYTECSRWNALIMAEIERIRPFAVITTGTRVQLNGESIPEGYLAKWEQILALGIPLILVRDTPYLPYDATVCTDQHGPEASPCMVKRAHIFEAQNPLDEVLRASPDVYRIDMTNYFCRGDDCPPTAGNILIYHDSNHIAASYGRTLSSPLTKQLQLTFPQLFE